MNPISANHPPAEVLARYKAGGLTSEERAQWDTHVDQCSICQLQLDQATQAYSDVKEAARQAPPPPPPIDGFEYELDDQAQPVRLGIGGLGVVYLGRETKPARPVAIKFLHTGYDLSESDRQRFAREAEAAARVSHPNIVQVIKYGTVAGRQYCVMEFVQGGTLADQVNDGPIDPPKAARWICTLARAMAYAHSRGVFHRDLKPANILAKPDRDGAVSLKIADFGLARMVDAPDLTGSGALLGTPGYMAPEQVKGQSDKIDARTDVYGLGATLYYLLAGQRPFADESGLALLQSIELNDPNPPLSRRSTERKRHADLETICLKCLRKSSDDRYGSAELLAEDLENYLAGRPIRARAVGRGERAIKWVRRNKAVTGLAAAVIVVFVASVVFAGIADRQRNRAITAEKENKLKLAKSYYDQARLASQQGMWPQTLENLNEAISSGHTDLFDLHRLKLTVHKAMLQSDQVQSQLHLLSKLADTNRQRAIVKLQNALELLGVDDDQLIALLQEIQVIDLPEADKSFVKGLLATSSPDAVDCMIHATELDPLHREARTTGAYLAILLGRFQSARPLVHGGRALYPSDPEMLFLSALLAALADGDLPEANRCMEQIASEYAALLKPRFKLTATTFSKYRDVRRFAYNSNALSRIRVSAAAIQDAGQIIAILQKTDVPHNARSFRIVVPPVIRQGLGKAISDLVPAVLGSALTPNQLGSLNRASGH